MATYTTTVLESWSKGTKAPHFVSFGPGVTLLSCPDFFV